MVSARPKAKPRSTGREMKPDRLPSRNSARPRKMTPTSATSAVASAAFIAGSAAAPRPLVVRPAILAARIAADEDVGETTAKRLRPTST